MYCPQYNNGIIPASRISVNHTPRFYAVKYLHVQYQILIFFTEVLKSHHHIVVAVFK